MSNYDDASLILYPSGYKEDKIYSLKPTDGSGDLTFTRASSATRVNEQGLIENAFVLGAELVTNGDFATDTSWTKSANVTISGGQATFTANGTNILLYQTASPSISVGSIVKLDYEIISNSLSDSTLRTGGIGGDDISSVINLESSVGVYSVYITARAGSSSRIMLWLSSTSGTLVIDNVSVKEYTTLNVPRIDYTGGGCGKLLLEPQRTNLALYNISFSGWSTIESTITANYGISPDGTTNATRILRTGSVRSVVYRGISVTNGQTYTVSLYVKSLSGTQNVRIGADNGCANPQGAETFAVGEEWTRIEKSITSTQNGWNIFIDNVESGIGCTGTYGALDILAYGFQCELGSYSTSLINTSGTAVTRLADSASKTGISSLIGQTEGTLYYEFNGGENDYGDYGISLSDGTTNNRIIIYRSGTNAIITNIRTASISVVTISTSTIIANANHKVAVGYANNNVVFYVNGVQIGTDTSAAIPATDRIVFDNGGGGVAQFYRPLNQLILFPTRLTNTELATLTTL